MFVCVYVCDMCRYLCAFVYVVRVQVFVYVVHVQVFVCVCVCGTCAVICVCSCVLVYVRPQGSKTVIPQESPHLFIYFFQKQGFSLKHRSDFAFRLNSLAWTFQESSGLCFPRPRATSRGLQHQAL